MSGIFDEYANNKGEYDSLDIKPFHTVRKKSEKEKLIWLNNAFQSLLKHSAARHHDLKKNLAAYRGLSRGFQSRSTPRREHLPESKSERLIVNHLYDMVETKVAQLSRLKPSIQVLPKNDEFGDKNAALASKMLIDHIFEQNALDSIERQAQKHKKIFGEAYLFTIWNKDLSESHPDAGLVLPDGSVVDPDLKIGDVENFVELPWRVLIEPADTYQKSKYAFRISVEHVDDLKQTYKEKRKEIKEDDAASMFDISSMENIKLKGQTIVIEFWHKKTKGTPGVYFKFTKDVILEETTDPYSHGDFPFTRVTDLDMPGELHGVSAMEQVKQIQSMHNSISSLIAKNIYLTAHPKWLVPKGAAKIESLGNDATIVQFQGQIPPQLATYSSNSAEVYTFRATLKEEMEQVYGVHGVSRGQPPGGVTAAVALQFLNEQEAERASEEISKKNEFIKAIAKKILAVAGDYYETEDNRLIRILGKENEYLLRHFDAANLSKPYDIKIDLGNAIADSKAGKTQRIIELIQYKPDALTAEQTVELLELGSAEKAVNMITAAVRTAESEIEDILQGKAVADPEPFDDLIVHWRVKVKAMQSRSFKEEVPPEFREALKENVAMIEFLAVEKAQENPKFQAELAQLSLFPLFYKQGFTPASAEQQATLVQGQANRGEQVTGAIPASDPGALPGEVKGE
jgi:hypothetical protein